jgi:sortase A
MDQDPRNLSVEDLERLLAIKRQVARMERIRAFNRSGRAVFRESPTPTLPGLNIAPSVPLPRKILDGALLAVEILAVVGMLIIVLQGANMLQDLRNDVAAGWMSPTTTPTALLQAVVLPAGHTPPTSPGGAVPNLNEIPANLRPKVQFSVTLAIPTHGPEQALRLDIPALGKLNLPILEGDSWDQLKQGVGHHIGSANPGPSGNVVLSAHNDIYGELFRDLDKLQPGNELILYSTTTSFTYRVIGIRIVMPTDLGVLSNTDRPTLTLISCYPYMVDNQRIIVTADQTGISS